MFRCLEQAHLTDPSTLHGVIVSDVGKAIEVRGSQRHGGMIRTSLRASDILMDRVWQLESERIEQMSGFIFALITDIVEPQEDPTALHPEIQRHTANIRTDLDRFSPLEIICLVRHGYCVGRKACRTRPDLFGEDLPANSPWDPIPDEQLNKRVALPPPHRLGPRHETAAVTVVARSLQASAQRRIWSTMLDLRDWMSYVYVPIVIPILFLLPYLVVKAYERSARLSHLVDSLSQGSRDLEVMTRLLEGPMTPWIGVVAEEARDLKEPDFKGFELLQDSRILDMRAWNPAESGKNDSESLVYGYRRVKVRRLANHPGNNIFRMDALATHTKTQVRFPPQQLLPKLQVSTFDNTISGEKMDRWEISASFADVPIGDFVDIIYEHISPGQFLRRGLNSTSLTFQTQADTAEQTRWFLMPRGREYRSFRIVRWETKNPDKVEPVRVITEFLADDYTILAYKLLAEKAGYTHEVTWYYK
jgi:hypothetical protein